MDFNLDDTQQQLQDVFASLFDKECTPQVVRDAEPLGFEPGLWNRVVDMGGLTMSVPAQAGGDGAGPIEAMLVAEQIGHHLAPVPFIEAVVAARALARLAAPSAREILDETLAGTGLLTFAVRPSRDRVARLAPGGAIADRLLAMCDGALVVCGSAGRGEHRENLGSLPLADWSIDDEVVVAKADEANSVFARAVDEWKVLTAAAMVGLAARAHQVGLEFVLDRKAFGVPIGAFQTVAHKLADSIVDIDGARFLTYEAAWLLHEDLTTAPSFASAAFAFASETAFRVAGECLHFHGGVGYTVEQDIQLYYRRAKAWPLVYGAPRDEYLKVADHVWGEPRPAAG